MPRGKWIDKKTAQHFTLVHRPQNDPLIHDADAPSMVLNPTNAPNASKVKKLDDLASELGSEAAEMRQNEGEAANYGVYYDDTEYDYMQHLRDLDSGNGSGEVVFVEAKNDTQNKGKGKGKEKQSLEDALRQLDVRDEERKKQELLGDDMLPSKNLQHLTYQSQQDVPDVIAGFQPDMDPRLREVLEALEDEAYVDDDDDVFQELAKDGHELDGADFEDIFEDDDGWETDDTAKPAKEYRKGDDDDDVTPQLVATGPAIAEDGDITGEEADVVQNENWLEDFKKFQKNQKTGGRTNRGAAGGNGTPSELQSSLMTTTTNGGRRKKRKGALTSQSGYSMTSSSLVRTEQMGILDARFESLEQRQYNPDGEDGEGEDDLASMSEVSTMSSVTGPMRGDFDSILDDFLGGYSMHGKKQVKKGGWKSGTDQLDEIRRDLGPARLGGRYGAAGGGGGRGRGRQSFAKPTAATALAFGAPSSSSASSSR
ncbi:Low temperature viability protein [Xylariomycetidae sp. FL2044]|nr:Low temperature viability protein [Xylariomycetidae sp. FL2044]